MENELQFETSYDSFVFVIRSPVTREKYLGRLAYFMTYVGITQGNIENRCNIFGEKCKQDSRWLANSVARYLRVHRKRVEESEISASTLSNYIKPVKYSVNNWKFRYLGRGLQEECQEDDVMQMIEFPKKRKYKKY